MWQNKVYISSTACIFLSSFFFERNSFPFTIYKIAPFLHDFVVLFYRHHQPLWMNIWEIFFWSFCVVNFWTKLKLNLRKIFVENLGLIFGIKVSISFIQHGRRKCSPKFPENYSKSSNDKNNFQQDKLKNSMNKDIHLSLVLYVYFFVTAKRKLSFV